jgi:hypothetical protein
MLNCGRILPHPLHRALDLALDQPCQASLCFTSEMQGSWHEATDSVSLAQSEYAKYGNASRKIRKVQVHDLVLLKRNRDLTKKSPKLEFSWIGRFGITEKNSPMTYKLELPASMRIHPVICVGLAGLQHRRLQSAPPSLPDSAKEAICVSPHARLIMKPFLLRSWKSFINRIGTS